MTPFALIAYTDQERGVGYLSNTPAEADEDGAERRSNTCLRDGKE